MTTPRPPIGPAPAEDPMRHEVIIRRCGADDLGHLYALATIAGDRWWRVSRRGLPNPHEFELAVWHGIAAQFVVTVDAVVLGVASIHDLDLHHGTAWTDIVMIDAPPHDTHGARVARHVVDHAFRHWPIRALYAGHTDLDAPPLGGCGVPGVVEARLQGYVHRDGRWWDRIITAIHRDDWAASPPVDPP